MPTAKTPADHKPKAGSPDDGYRFTVDGVTYTLPPVTEEDAQKLPGSLTMDIVEKPDDPHTQAKYGFALLRLMVKDDVVDALRSLPTGEMMEILGGWMMEGEQAGSSEQ